MPGHRKQVRGGVSGVGRGGSHEEERDGTISRQRVQSGRKKPRGFAGRERRVSGGYPGIFLVLLVLRLLTNPCSFFL